MSEQNKQTRHDISRRRFLKRSSLGLAGATAAAEIPFVHTAFAGADTSINIGLIGCGGRGTGAALDVCVDGRTGRVDRCRPGVVQPDAAGPGRYQLHRQPRRFLPTRLAGTDLAES